MRTALALVLIVSVVPAYAEAETAMCGKVTSIGSPVDKNATNQLFGFEVLDARIYPKRGKMNFNLAIVREEKNAIGMLTVVQGAFIANKNLYVHYEENRATCVSTLMQDCPPDGSELKSCINSVRARK